MKKDSTLISGLKNLLQRSSVVVKFVKKDNTERVMLCTLATDLIPDEHKPKGETSPLIEKNLNIIRVFDIENQGWRSIICDNIISF